MELEKRLTEQTEEIQAERLDSQRRLRAWMDEERRVFEERLRNHVESETAALEERYVIFSGNISKSKPHTRILCHIVGDTTSTMVPQYSEILADPTGASASRYMTRSITL